MSARALIIAGPTAIGKSALALELAQRLNGEIISVDSMQVYRGLDIGTAKPSAAERAQVPHHLIDVCDLTDAFDAARFVELAREAESQILSRERLPIYCGGTGLYFKALLHGLDTSAPVDAELRTRLESLSLPDLQSELQRLDPAAAEQIDVKNPRRVIRALEIRHATGQSAATHRNSWQSNPALQSYCAIALEAPRDTLNARINRRVTEMFDRGLVEETRALLQVGLEQNRTAMQAIGYRQVVEHLQGERDLRSTIELIQQKTRQFAKRQMTWFKRQLEFVWLDGTASDLADQTTRIWSERRAGS